MRRRDLRAAAPIQAERGGQRQVLYGAPLEKDPSSVVRKGRPGAHSGSRLRSSSVFREAVRETGCVGRRAPRGPVGWHPPEDVRPAGTRRPAPRLASRGVPTSCDELCSPDPAASVSEHGRAEQPRAGHPRRDHGSPGRWRVRASSGPRLTEVQGRRNGSPRRRLDSSHPSGASSGSEAAPHQPGRGGAHCPRAQGRHEAQALSRRLGRHEEQGQEHAGRQREGRGQGPGEGEGRQEERRLRQPDHAARREGRQEGDGEGERERKGGRQEAAVDGTGSEEVDCELAGGLDALMLDAFGASVLDDAARPEKGMLLDDGHVDAIDSEFLERLSLVFHAALDLTAWRSTLGLLGNVPL